MRDDSERARFERAMKNKAWRERAEKWLKTNPPPKTWKGTPMEWAFCEMLSLPWWLL